MSKRFTRESVDLIYENAKDTGYQAGFKDGYNKCMMDVKKMVNKLRGKE